MNEWVDSNDNLKKAKSWTRDSVKSIGEGVGSIVNEIVVDDTGSNSSKNSNRTCRSNDVNDLGAWFSNIGNNFLNVFSAPVQPNPNQNLKETDSSVSTGASSTRSSQQSSTNFQRAK